MTGSKLVSSVKSWKKNNLKKNPQHSVECNCTKCTCWFHYYQRVKVFNHTQIYTLTLLFCWVQYAQRTCYLLFKSIRPALLMERKKLTKKKKGQLYIKPIPNTTTKSTQMLKVRLARIIYRPEHNCQHSEVCLEEKISLGVSEVCEPAIQCPPLVSANPVQKSTSLLLRHLHHHQSPSIGKQNTKICDTWHHYHSQIDWV